MAILSHTSSFNLQPTRSRPINNPFERIHDYIHTVWINTCQFSPDAAISCHFPRPNRLSLAALPAFFVSFVPLWLKQTLSVHSVVNQKRPTHRIAPTSFYSLCPLCLCGEKSLGGEIREDDPAHLSMRALPPRRMCRAHRGATQRDRRVPSRQDRPAPSLLRASHQ